MFRYEVITTETDSLTGKEVRKVQGSFSRYKMMKIFVLALQKEYADREDFSISFIEYKASEEYEVE